MYLQTGTEIERLYEIYRSSSSLFVPWISFYQQCYDATWALGRALSMTLKREKQL